MGNTYERLDWPPVEADDHSALMLMEALANRTVQEKISAAHIEALLNSYGIETFPRVPGRSKRPPQRRTLKSNRLHVSKRVRRKHRKQ